MHRRRFVRAALLPFGLLAGCESLKPQSRVRLGMSSREVESLIGPVWSQKWLYWNADKSQTIEVDFQGEYVVRTVLIVMKNGFQTVESIAATGRDARRYRANGDSRTVEIIAPSSIPLPDYGAASASVLKLLGVPQEAHVNYVVDPLRGEFENDKLARWSTTRSAPPI